MSINDRKQYEPSAIKNAAESLTRGASLINEACPKCRGVQVKFKEITTCINCGNEQRVSSDESSKDLNQLSLFKDYKPIPLELIENLIAHKIVNLVNIFDDDNEDISDQKKKADLLELYLRIIEKTRHLKNNFDFKNHI